ncbi:hypothetical protein [Pseudomonas syringae]|uniref:Uncharacterized protein n=1 Tax=Pseudomonas syringae TaxID=317 RepID=A0A085VAI1_PSESX|nr:hypothetical protein [Pseudomonas syringae]KFE52444.1 hypothetical protein IV02_08405 [Pseudomonas syringae]
MSLYSKRKQTSPLSAVLVILVVLAIMAGAGYAISLSFNREKIDKVTLCPTSGAKGEYVVLIDNTSPFPFTQKAALAKRLKDMVLNEVPQGAMLTVFLLGEDYQQNSEPVFERCNPGQWTDKNKLMNSQKFVDRDFNEKFANPLDGVIRKIPLDVRAKTSPIFEMLMLASLRGFGHEKASGEKHLIIYSDMAANMPRFSMYKNPHLTYKNFAGTPYGREAVAPALADVSVSINMMAAEPTVTAYTQRAEFWAQYLSANGASLDQVNPMEGL